MPCLQVLLDPGIPLPRSAGGTGMMIRWHQVDCAFITHTAWGQLNEETWLWGQIMRIHIDDIPYNGEQLIEMSIYIRDVMA